jgi:hypothetical protein
VVRDSKFLDQINVPVRWERIIEEGKQGKTRPESLQSLFFIRIIQL